MPSQTPPTPSVTIRYTFHATPFGEVLLAATDKGICTLMLSPLGEEQLLGPVREKSGVILIREGEAFRGIVRELDRYFQGTRMKFDDDLDLRGGTTFQVKVWTVLRQIPYGETRSYKWVASKLGDPYSVRAVGQAVGQNPVPIIIPCHRVIHENGSLGGFSGGILWKQRLLALERGQSGLF